MEKMNGKLVTFTGIIVLVLLVAIFHSSFPYYLFVYNFYSLPNIPYAFCKYTSHNFISICVSIKSA